MGEIAAGTGARELPRCRPTTFDGMKQNANFYILIS